jgi:hypothetical protein
VACRQDGRREREHSRSAVRQRPQAGRERTPVRQQRRDGRHESRRASAGGSAIGTGINGIGAGLDQYKGLFDIANAGGAGQQASGQAAIDNAKGMSEYGTDRNQKALQDFFSIIGANNWGGTQQGTQTSTPSTWSTIGSGLGLA